MSITNVTIKKLFGLSKNQCAFPKCTQSVIDYKAGIVIGEICHIKAKNLEGSRYDSAQSSNERDSYQNLILLCPTHHTIVDNDIGSYTVERLLEIKSDHEKSSNYELDWPEIYTDQLIEKINLPSINHETIIKPINPVGGQYAQSIQNINAGIELEKNYTYADVLEKLYSNQGQLSELLAKTLNLAKKSKDETLSNLCISELSGWAKPDPQSTIYRKKEVYVSLNYVRKVFNYTSNEELWHEFERTEDFIKSEFFFNEVVPILEQALELNKSVNPLST